MGWPGHATLGPIHQPWCRLSIPGHSVSPTPLRAVVSCRECATRGQHRPLPSPLPPPAPHFSQDQAGAGLGGVSFSHGSCQKSLSRFVWWEPGVLCPGVHHSVRPGTRAGWQREVSCSSTPQCHTLTVPATPLWRCLHGCAHPVLAPEQHEHQRVTRGLPTPLPSPGFLRSINSLVNPRRLPKAPLSTLGVDFSTFPRVSPATPVPPGIAAGLTQPLLTRTSSAPRRI